MAKQIDDERLSFIVEWYEELAARTRQFQFTFFVHSLSIEMYDTRNHKMFLRTSVQDLPLRPADLYIGNSINVMGRQLKIADYADQYTQTRCSSLDERTLALIKPDAEHNLGPILDLILRKQLLISRLRKCQLDRPRALDFYRDHVGKPHLNALLDSIISGPVVVMELMGADVVKVWRDIMGPADPAQARTTHPESIRALYGTDIIYNSVHGSESSELAAREIEFFFSSQGALPPNTAAVGNCSCCIVKPSAYKTGYAGRIIQAIGDAGFTIGAAQLYTLEKANAEEFLAVYKGVVHEYGAMVTELTSGPCLVLEVKVKDDDPPVVPAFRQLAGPADPEIARHLRPKTLRAIFGTDKVKNAVHCTDLPEDGQLEVEYFFRILDR